MLLMCVASCGPLSDVVPGGHKGQQLTTRGKELRRHLFHFTGEGSHLIRPSLTGIQPNSFKN